MALAQPRLLTIAYYRRTRHKERCSPWAIKRWNIRRLLGTVPTSWRGAKMKHPIATLLVSTLVAWTVAEISATPRCGRFGCPEEVSASARRPAPTTGIPAPDLSQCALLGREIARSKYFDEMRKDTQVIKKDIGATSSLYYACGFLTGSSRNSCCQGVADQSVKTCQERIIAQEHKENPCAPKPVDCRRLRPAKCAVERMIEHKRVQCCNSIDGQVLNNLLATCNAAVADLSASCFVPETPAPIGTHIPENTPSTPSL